MNGRSVSASVAVSRSARPGMGTRRGSVYLSARESLDDTDLKALKEFEDAAVASMGGNESLYFDTLEALDVIENDHLSYAPASVAEPRRHRESVLMEDPATLLKVMKN